MSETPSTTTGRETPPAGAVCASGRGFPGRASGRRYVLITPCRDEAPYLPGTIASVAAQTVPPALWVIVDDGSTDDTPTLLARAAAEHGFIRVVRRTDRGVRAVGPGVIEAFYAGLRTIELANYDYLCKFDADLELPPRYFERLIEEMERMPRLGAVSGKMFLRDADGQVHHERRGDDHAAGPTKFYRRECFLDIGGFVQMVGWDGIDGHTCRMRGWVAKSMLEDDLRAVHLRQMGSSHKSVLHGRVRGGEGKWRIGSSPWYVLATAVYRLADKPYVIGSLAMVWGYFRAMIRRVPRHEPPGYLRHLRRYEWRSLLRGRRYAAEQSEREAASRSGAAGSARPGGA